MPYVYIDDGSKVPDGLRVYEDRFGYFEDQNGRKIANVKDGPNPFGAPLAGQQDAGAFTRVEAGPELQAQLDNLSAKLDALLAK